MDATFDYFSRLYTIHWPIKASPNLISIMNRIFGVLSLVLVTLLWTKSIQACTVISAALKGEVFAAANEDDYTPFSRIWFNPATKDRYGSVCFGHPDLATQAAINEHGLFFDFTAQNINPANYSIKHPFQGDLFFIILGKCRTVKEALEFMKTHNYAFSSQALLADAQGNSVIINAGIQVEKKGMYQINTNFNICEVETGNYSCRRYDIANEMLGKADQLSVPLFRKILSQTRQEGKLSTQYSNIYDLKRGLIYVYYFHDFENPYIIDLKKEIKKGYHLQKLSTLFPNSFAYETYSKSHALYRKEKLLDKIDEVGLDSASHYYVQLEANGAQPDTSVSVVLLEVALQLVKNTFNQYNEGGMWEYWYSLPGGYKPVHTQDRRLVAADKLMEGLMQDKKIDDKTQRFIGEIYAYSQLAQGRKDLAKLYYEKAAESPDKNYKSSYIRAQKMLAVISSN